MEGGEEVEGDDDEDEGDNQERAKIEHIAEIESARSKTPFNHTLKELDLRKRRATDCKENARVILPRAMSTKKETSLLIKGQELRLLPQHQLW